MSPRTASEMSDTGFAFDQACSQPGIEAVRTNASLVNVIGNSTTKPKICTFSGLAASIETSTSAHEMARVETSTRAKAASTPSALVPILNPRMYPIPSSKTMAQVCLARSATMRPASGANRAIGSERSRSKNPSFRSVDSPVAVFSVVNSEFCTMMPGSANIRYACGEPPIAPPNTYVNRSRNITGWTLKSISSSGLCLIWTSVRQASENVCRSPSTGPTRGVSARPPPPSPSPSGLSETVLSIRMLSMAVVMPPRSLPLPCLPLPCLPLPGLPLSGADRSATGTPRPGSTRAG